MIIFSELYKTKINNLKAACASLNLYKSDQL